MPKPRQRIIVTVPFEGKPHIHRAPSEHRFLVVKHQTEHGWPTTLEIGIGKDTHPTKPVQPITAKQWRTAWEPVFRALAQEAHKQPGRTGIITQWVISKRKRFIARHRITHPQAGSPVTKTVSFQVKAGLPINVHKKNKAVVKTFQRLARRSHQLDKNRLLRRARIVAKYIEDMFPRKRPTLKSKGVQDAMTLIRDNRFIYNNATMLEFVMRHLHYSTAQKLLEFLIKEPDDPEFKQRCETVKHELLSDKPVPTAGRTETTRWFARRAARHPTSASFHFYPEKRRGKPHTSTEKTPF